MVMMMMMVMSLLCFFVYVCSEIAFCLSYMFVVPVDTVLCFHVIHYMLFVYLLMFDCLFFLMNSYLGFHVFAVFLFFQSSNLLMLIPSSSRTRLYRRASKNTWADG